MKRVFLSVVGFISYPTHAQTPLPEQQAFQAYTQSQKQAFQQYITDQKQAFKAYKQAYKTAFEEYKKQIQQNWDTPETSTPKKWIAYDDHFNQKTAVDFKTNTVTITRLVKNPKALKQAEAKVMTQFAQLQKLTYQKAYQSQTAVVKADQTIRQTVAPSLLKTTPPPKKTVALISHPDPRRIQLKVVKIKRQPAVQLTYSLKTEDIQQRVKQFIQPSIASAQKEQLPPSLILAIMENESRFNPMATSPIPAFGLMQVVPTSAGKDATQYLFGQPKLLSASYLYTPHHNIKIGSGYLHILYHRYLRKIKNPTSRLYCTIAAYNTGAGNVAKAYTGNYNISKAAELINQQTPDQVYRHLIRHLPYGETKRYLKRVTGSIRKYQTLFHEKLI